MKFKGEYALREVANKIVAVPVGENMDLNTMITLNETGMMLWKCIEKQMDIEGMVQALMAEYDVDAALARTAVDSFVAQLNANGFLAE